MVGTQQEGFLDGSVLAFQTSLTTILSDLPKIKSCEHIYSCFWDECHSVILGRSSNSWPYTSKAFLERVVGRAHSERTTPGWLLSRFSLFLSCRSSLYTLDMNLLLIHLLKVVHVLRPEEFVKIQGRDDGWVLGGLSLKCLRNIQEWPHRDCLGYISKFS